MTALERRWVESEWEHGLLSGHWLRNTGETWPEVWIEGGAYRANLYGFSHPPILGPAVSTLAEAKRDAESMYRQWVYDEYGVVLP